MDNGNELVVNAPNNSAANVYVQSLSVNGKPWDRVYLPHAVIAGGAVARLPDGPATVHMGLQPGRATAVAHPGRRRAEDDAGHHGHARRPRRGQRRRPTSRPLFDDTTRTQVMFRTPTAVARVPALPETGAPVRYYTLTSGTAGDDPRSWTLRGSDDGATLDVLDERDGETFRWRRQTRPFRVANPGAYSTYRLDITENSGAADRDTRPGRAARPLTCERAPSPGKGALSNCL